MKHLTGKDIIHLPAGCDLDSEELGMKIAGPVETSIESFLGVTNSSVWERLQSQYHSRVHSNRTTITRLHLSKAKAELSGH